MWNFQSVYTLERLFQRMRNGDNSFDNAEAYALWYASEDDKAEVVRRYRERGHDALPLGWVENIKLYYEVSEEPLPEWVTNLMEHARV
jgi:hypothetical protein